MKKLKTINILPVTDLVVKYSSACFMSRSLHMNEHNIVFSIWYIQKQDEGRA